MARVKLTRTLRWKARASFYPIILASDAARSLPYPEESDQDYIERIKSRRLRFEVDHRLYFEINPSLIAQEELELGEVEQSKRAGHLSEEEAKIKIEALLTRISELHLLDELADRRVNFGEQFLAAAVEANPGRLRDLAEHGAPVNYQDPRNGATALHYVASQGARPAFRALLKIGQCDFLVRDNQGRLASELAGVYGRDMAMERLLLAREIKQAKTNGIPLEQIYRKDPVSRPAPSS
jgi:hypothetical protein